MAQQTSHTWQSTYLGIGLTRTSMTGNMETRPSMVCEMNARCANLQMPDTGERNTHGTHTVWTETQQLNSRLSFAFNALKVNSKSGAPKYGSDVTMHTHRECSKQKLSAMLFNCACKPRHSRHNCAHMAKNIHSYWAHTDKHDMHMDTALTFNTSMHNQADSTG